MPGVALEETVNCDNPLLQFTYHVNGILTDVYELSFVIQDIQNSEERVTSTAVDLTACADGGDKLGTGRYVAGITASAPTWIGGKPLGTTADRPQPIPPPALPPAAGAQESLGQRSAGKFLNIRSVLTNPELDSNADDAQPAPKPDPSVELGRNYWRFCHHSHPGDF